MYYRFRTRDDTSDELHEVPNQNQPRSAKQKVDYVDYLRYRSLQDYTLQSSSRIYQRYYSKGSLNAFEGTSEERLH
jgi:hypothetical protein